MSCPIFAAFVSPSLLSLILTANQCSGGRPSCVRCLSRGILCVYGPSTTPDSHSTSPRTSHRRKSHSGSSALRPQDLKVSTRTRSERRSSAADSELRRSVQAPSSEFKDLTYCAAFFNDLPTNLDEDLSTHSRLALFGDEFESPVEPHTPPFLSSPTSLKPNPFSYKFSGLSRYIFYFSWQLKLEKR